MVHEQTNATVEWQFRCMKNRKWVEWLLKGTDDEKLMRELYTVVRRVLYI